MMGTFQRRVMWYAIEIVLVSTVYSVSCSPVVIWCDYVGDIQWW